MSGSMTSSTRFGGCPPSPTTSSTSPGWRSPSGRPPSSPCPSRPGGGDRPVLPGRGQEPGKTFSLRIQPTLTLVGGGEEPGTAGVHPAGQRSEVFPRRGEITVTLARQGKSLLLTVANTAQTLSKELLEEHVRPVLPGGTRPAVPSRGAMASACPSPRRWYRATKENLRRRPKCNW